MQGSGGKLGSMGAAELRLGTSSTKTVTTAMGDMASLVIDFWARV
jgi:hypothetical protein